MNSNDPLIRPDRRGSRPRPFRPLLGHWLGQTSPPTRRSRPRRRTASAARSARDRLAFAASPGRACRAGSEPCLRLASGAPPVLWMGVGQVPREAGRVKVYRELGDRVCGRLLMVSTGVDPIQLTEYSVVFSVVVMPLTYLPVLLVARDRTFMGEYANGRVASFFGWVIYGRDHGSRHRRHPLLSRPMPGAGDGRNEQLDLAYRFLDLDLVDSEGRRCESRRRRLERRPGRARLRRGGAQWTGALPARFIRRLRAPARRIFRGGRTDVPSKLIEDFDATVTLGGTAKELGLAQGDRRLAALFGDEEEE